MILKLFHQKKNHILMIIIESENYEKTKLFIFVNVLLTQWLPNEIYKKGIFLYLNIYLSSNVG